MFYFVSTIKSINIAYTISLHSTAYSHILCFVKLPVTKASITKSSRTFPNNRIGPQQYIYLSPYILLACSNLYLQMGSNNKCVVDFNASKKHWSLLNNRLSKWSKHRVLSIYQYWIIKRITWLVWCMLDDYIWVFHFPFLI